MRSTAATKPTVKTHSQNDSKRAKPMPAYIELFHGRTDPKEELEDWGHPGPIFGPLQFVHTTYARDIKFNYADESRRGGWLNVTEDLVYYDGVYYGDWSVFTELRDDLSERLVDFEQSKAEPPRNCWYVIRLHGGIEPEVIGPFPTEIERDERARELRKENDEDVIVQLNSTDPNVAVSAYSAGYLASEADQ
jgi:hypothetical protein